MKTVRWIVNFICIVLIIIYGFFFVESVGVSYFIFSGQLIVGQPMYVDSITPDLESLVKTMGISILIIIACIFIRAKIGKEYDFKFLKPKNT